MNIKFLCPRWGFENTSWANFLGEVSDAGYSGIEWFPFAESSDYKQVLQLLQQQKLQFSIVMTVMKHLENFEDYLEVLRGQLLELGSIRDGVFAPLFITAQTGREYYSTEQVDRIIECCRLVSQQTGIPIYQETHRNKWAYAAHATFPYLVRYPELPITLDISHWFCVSESYLDDQQDAVSEAIRHTKHIHARIGHTQGPQVKDPSLPEYKAALEAHLAAWDQWINFQMESGLSDCTITTEFGPPPYLIHADTQGTARQEQWRLNVWMKDYLTKRYKGVVNDSSRLQ